MTDQTLEQTAALTPTQIVEKYLFALAAKDFDTARSLLADDVLYQNVGFSSVRGGDNVLKFLNSLRNPRAGLVFEIHRSTADGTSVMNERTDILTFGRFHMKFWVCGVFEVHEGRITLWRDYFDAFDFTKNAARGLLAIAIPALRQRF